MAPLTAPRTRLLAFTTSLLPRTAKRPPHRPLTLLTSRPRLPPLLRPLPPTPHPTPHYPPRRLISAKTKAYLYRESLIAARIVIYGYTAILITAVTAASAAIIYTESQIPTPSSHPWRSRIGFSSARALVEWIDAYSTAVDMMVDVVTELEAAGWEGKDTGWRMGYIQALKYLAELEEHQDHIEAAQRHYQQIVDLPRGSARQESQWQEMKVAAALRVSKIAAFRKDPDTAEKALLQAVSVALPRGEPVVAGELPALPDVGSVENTALLLKAVTELGVYYAQSGQEGRALELFTRVLAARRNQGEMGDPCAEAGTMTYIGEVMFAMGDQRQGVAWTKEAFKRSEGLAEVREACRECAIVAGRNVGTMIALMKGEGRREKGGKLGRLFGKEREEESVEEWEETVKRLEGIKTTGGL